MTEQLTFAVLTDGENCSHSCYADVLSEVAAAGNIAIKWVYADWTLPNHKSWEKEVLRTASAVKQQFHISKDAADHALIMDTIELICTNERINAICLVTSDGGFAGLAQRVREKGLHVMGIGKKLTPDPLRNACHNFVFIENLGGDRDAPPLAEDSDLDSLLMDAFNRESDGGEPVYLGDLGKAIKKCSSSFDQRNYGYSTLKALIRAKSRYLEITGEKNDRCFVRQKVFNGTIKAAPGSRDFAFIISDGEKFYVNRREMVEPARWNELAQKTGVTFSVSQPAADAGSAPAACNVAVRRNSNSKN